MRRFPLAIMAFAMGLAACTELATAPQQQAGSDITARYRLSNPPPPPIDTGATGFFTPTGIATNVLKSSLSPSYTVSVSSIKGASFDVSPFSFNIPVTYFLNKTDNSGYLHFGGNAHGGDVKFKKGFLDGKGNLIVDLGNGILKIDLSSLEQPPSFFGCGTEVIGGAPTNNFGGVCFGLFFDSATFTPPGGPTVPGTVSLFPEDSFPE